MEDYSQEVKIIADQVSPFQTLKPSALFRLFQDVAIRHVEQLGMPREYTLKKNLIWVIAKQRAEIIRMPKYNETIKVSTWPSKTMHILFPRSYEIRDENNNIIVKATSIWALIDINTRKMVNPVDYGIDVKDVSYGREFSMPFSNRIPFDLSEIGTIEAKYSLCDLNGHINNTSYLDIAENMIPISFLKEHKLKLIDIKYIHEIPLGSSLPVKYGYVNNSYYFVNEAFQLQLGY